MGTDYVLCPLQPSMIDEEFARTTLPNQWKDVPEMKSFLRALGVLPRGLEYLINRLWNLNPEETDLRDVWHNMVEDINLLYNNLSGLNKDEMKLLFFLASINFPVKLNMMINNRTLAQLLTSGNVFLKQQKPGGDLIIDIPTIILALYNRKGEFIPKEFVCFQRPTDWKTLEAAFAFDQVRRRTAFREVLRALNQPLRVHWTNLHRGAYIPDTLKKKVIDLEQNITQFTAISKFGSRIKRMGGSHVDLRKTNGSHVITMTDHHQGFNILTIDKSEEGKIFTMIEAHTTDPKNNTKIIPFSSRKHVKDKNILTQKVINQPWLKRGKESLDVVFFYLATKRFQALGKLKEELKNEDVFLNSILLDQDACRNYFPSSFFWLFDKTENQNEEADSEAEAEAETMHTDKIDSLEGEKSGVMKESKLQRPEKKRKSEEGDRRKTKKKG
eukprot:TRINITY_DN495_c0_g1_i3.p1 TRINITY_DN495_c0_g1~~TRINITY_DN495_c0_g1_i3.p1  ORF type:complete len:442 (-),score=98.63 TRINITY_DN495_c0_g1_i3:79-1404(-)